jgi:hypothetical protein
MKKARPRPGFFVEMNYPAASSEEYVPKGFN